MSEREFQPELNDELLSAYLDDELSAEERAAVEARLANDVDAQQLLHQLRGVSESVQRLPLESVGRDLSGEILRRAQAVKAGGGVATSDAATPMGSVPEIRIFGSRRSWFWASLAVAAGLMIMALHLGDDKGRKLADVAGRDRNGSVDRELAEQKIPPSEVANGPRPETSEIDATKTAKLEASGAATAAPSGQVAVNGRAAGAPGATAFGGGAPSSSSISTDTRHENLQREESQLADGGAARAPSNMTLGVSGESKTDAGKVAESLPASSPRPMAANRTTAAASPSAASGDLAASKAPKPADAMVVIHVVAKSEAFRSRAFDRTLADHQIEFEVSEGEKKVVGEVDQKVVNGADGGQLAAGKDDRADRVIVEAPEETVAACLAALEQDKANYVSVKIDEPTDAAFEFAHNELAKQLGAELAPADRPDSPAKEKSESHARFYATDETSKDALRDKAEVGREPAANQRTAPEPSGERLRRAVSGGRALRLLSQDSDKIEPNEAKPRGGGTGGGGMATRRVRAGTEFDLKKSASEHLDDVRVLFIVSPESDSAAGAPAQESKQ